MVLIVGIKKQGRKWRWGFGSVGKRLEPEPSRQITEHGPIYLSEPNNWPFPKILTFIQIDLRKEDSIKTINHEL